MQHVIAQLKSKTRVKRNLCPGKVCEKYWCVHFFIGQFFCFPRCSTKRTDSRRWWNLPILYPLDVCPLGTSKAPTGSCGTHSVVRTNLRFWQQPLMIGGVAFRALRAEPLRLKPLSMTRMSAGHTIIFAPLLWFFFFKSQQRTCETTATHPPVHQSLTTSHKERGKKEREVVKSQRLITAATAERLRKHGDATSSSVWLRRHVKH